MTVGWLVPGQANLDTVLNREPGEGKSHRFRQMIKTISRHYTHYSNFIITKKNEVGGWHNLLFHSSLTLTFTSALSYLLGLTRDKVFAHTLGASTQLDVYNAAFVVPDFLFAVLVSGALGAAFVPIFTSLDEKSKAKAILYTNQMLSWLLLLLATFSLIFGIFLPFLAPWLVKGFSPEQLANYIFVTRIMLLSPFLFTLSNTFGNALLSIKSFLWYGLAPVVYNIGIIIGVLALYPRWGVSGLVVGTVFGACLHMAVRAQEMYRYGFRPKLVLQLSPEVIDTVKLMLPKMIQIGMWQIMLWWFVNLASQTGVGGVTTYNFAYNFQSVPVSLVGMALALSAFADLSRLGAEQRYQDFSATVKKGLTKILVITSLAAVGLALVSYPLVTLLLGGGKFTPDAVAMTASLLLVYTVSVPFESMMHLMARAHYALRNTFRPSLIHVLAICVSIAVSTLLLPKVGIYALPIAFSTGFIFQDILLFISLWNLIQTKS